MITSNTRPLWLLEAVLIFFAISVVGCGQSPSAATPAFGVGGGAVTATTTTTAGGSASTGVATTTAAGGATASGVTSTTTSGAAGSASATVSTASTTAAAGGTGSTVVGNCTFTVNPSLSTAIPTVGIVEWSTDLANLTSAEVDFSLVGATNELNQGGIAPVDVSAGTSFRTLLLGLKGSRDYSFQIVANAGGTVCTSEAYTLTTGTLAGNVPTIMRQSQNEAAQDIGFIITSGGLGGGFGGGGGGIGGGGGGGAVPAYIIDADGDVVWWAAAPASCSRARMNWEGTDMWMLELNVDNQGGEMRRVSMDGLDTENNIQGMSDTHHDFTVLPGGIVAAMSWTSSGMDPPSDLLERSPDGTIKTIARDSDLYNSNTYHSNSIHYHQADDSYTIGDRNPNAYVKVTRSGQVVWQFGGDCTNAPAPACAPGNWQVNHGHHLLDNGNFLFFNNGAGQGGGGMSTAYEYQFDLTQTSLTATQVWSYNAANTSSMVLGDVQRLPNGNTLVTFSVGGTIHEVDPSGNLVQTLTASGFGYANFRESLYGPPPR